MAKKEKKVKKEKQPKGKKGRHAKAAKEPDIPYAGSDRVKSALAVLLAILCGVCIGLSVYTVSYLSRNADAEAAAAAIAAQETLSAASVSRGQSLFSQPDGTFIRW